MAAKPRMLIIGARGIKGNEGGVEKFAEEFSKRACRHLDLTVTCLDLHEHEQAENIRVVRIKPFPFLNTDKALYYMTAARLCLTERFDYVFLLGINSAILSLVSKFLPFRNAFVLARSGSVDYMLAKWGALGKLYFRVSEQALRAADLVIAVSPSIQNHLAAKGVQSKVIGNGVDVRVPAPWAHRRASKPVIIAVGRLTAQKNYGVLLDAARRLGDDVNIRIVGGPDQTGESSRLEQIIRGQGIGNVTMTGPMLRGEVFREMEAASVYVNCSVHEGMSNSVLEAIQHRLPLVLSDIPANRDLRLADRVYFNADSAPALAERITAASKTPEAFIAPPENFSSWDEIVRQILEEIGIEPKTARLVGAARPHPAAVLQSAAAFKD